MAIIIQHTFTEPGETSAPFDLTGDSWGYSGREAQIWLPDGTSVELVRLDADTGDRIGSIPVTASGPVRIVASGLFALTMAAGEPGATVIVEQ